MSAKRFQSLSPPQTYVTAALNGQTCSLPTDRTLLAALLERTEPNPAPDWFCAIGQCQRCQVHVNGYPKLACQVVVRADDVIKCSADWSG